MEIQEELTIPARREEVYRALNDVNVLKACIPPVVKNWNGVVKINF